jgi:hypothetical protein
LLLKPQVDQGMLNMQLVEKTKRVVTFLMYLGVLLGTSPTADAINKNITAEFKVDPAKPNQNIFVNTTPQEGYCVRYPTNCSANKTFSLQLPIRFSSVAPIEANHTDQRKGAMFKVPADWRAVEVINKKNNQRETVEVRISGIGVLWMTDEDVDDLVGFDNGDWAQAHKILWEGGAWLYPPNGCGYSGSADWGPRHYASFWIVPSDVVCAKQAKFRIPDLRYEYVDFAYELRTPNPLGMSDGDYEGQITYRIGPNMDFDMGEIMVSTESEVTLELKLNVKHTLKVTLPPGGNKVELLPPGGWQQWLSQGRKPTRLFRDQTFNISTSSRFKMWLECPDTGGDNACHIRDAVSAHSVPVSVSVSLPYGLVDEAERPVNHHPLQLDSSTSAIFQPGFYLDRRAGTLHFEIPASQVEQMLVTDQSRHYAGTVTVVWDSEV